MLIVENVIDTHHVEHPTEQRRYAFRVLEAYTVEVERWADGQLVYRTRMDTSKARRLYAYLRTLGYVKW